LTVATYPNFWMRDQNEGIGKKTIEELDCSCNSA